MASTLVFNERFETTAATMIRGKMAIICRYIKMPP